MTKTKIRRRLLRLPKPEPVRDILDETKLLVESDEGVTWQKKYFKYGEVVVGDGEDSAWVYVVKAGSLSVMTKLEGIRSQKVDEAPGSDVCGWTLSSRCRSGLHVPRKKPAVYKPSVLASSHESPVSYKNQFDMLNKLEERIPGVYNVKKRLGLIDYDAIIAEAKLRLPRKLREISATETETDVPVLPPIASLETGRARAAPDRRLEASRLRLPHLAQEKNIYLCIPGRSPKYGSTRKSVVTTKQAPAGKSEDIEEGQEEELPNRRTTQAGGRGGCEKKRPSRHTPPTFVRLQVLEKGQHFGRVDPTPPRHPPVTVVSNGAECILLSKSFLSRHREDAMWKMCGKPDLPRPREDTLRHSVLDERRWQAARSRIFDRLARRSRCRAALIRQFPPSYAGQYSFRTGPTPR